MSPKKIILSAVLIWIAQTVFIMLTCGWLFRWVYLMQPYIWLTPEQMVVPASMIGNMLVSLSSSFIFVIVYHILYKAIPFEGAKKGAIYGIIIWLVGSLPGFAIMPYFMTISGVVIIYWIIQQFVLGIVKGAIVGAICQEKK